MWLLDYALCIAVAEGFIALAGVAAETGLIMLLYLEHAWEEVTAGGTATYLGRHAGRAGVALEPRDGGPSEAANRGPDGGR